MRIKCKRKCRIGLIISPIRHNRALGPKIGPKWPYSKGMAKGHARWGQICKICKVGHGPIFRNLKKGLICKNTINCIWFAKTMRIKCKRKCRIGLIISPIRHNRALGLILALIWGQNRSWCMSKLMPIRRLPLTKGQHAFFQFHSDSQQSIYIESYHIHGCEMLPTQNYFHNISFQI